MLSHKALQLKGIRDAIHLFDNSLVDKGSRSFSVECRPMMEEFGELPVHPAPRLKAFLQGLARKKEGRRRSVRVGDQLDKVGGHRGPGSDAFKTEFFAVLGLQ